MDLQALLIKHNLSRVSKLHGLEADGLRALGEDGLLALGLSALEMTRVHVAFGRLHDKQAVGYLLARLEMAQHAPLFEKHDVDLDTFQLLTDDDLADMGIGLAMHREILLSSSCPTHVDDKQPHPCAASAPVRGIAAPRAGSESLDVEQEGERQVDNKSFRELLVERSEVVAKLCSRLAASKNRERSLCMALDRTLVDLRLDGKLKDHEVASEALLDTVQSEEAASGQQGDDSRSEDGAWGGDDLNEPITMLVRALTLLSDGKSQALRSALIDGCAPILCELADRHRLIRWSTEMSEASSKDGLLPAICAQLAKEILRIFSLRPALQLEACNFGSIGSSQSSQACSPDISQSEVHDDSLMLNQDGSQAGVHENCAHANLVLGLSRYEEKGTEQGKLGRNSISSTPSTTTPTPLTPGQLLPRRAHLTPREQASLGLKLKSDANGFPVVVGFESGTSCLTADNGDAYNLEEGCKILSIDSQHTQFVPMDDVYKWLQGPPRSLVMICFGNSAGNQWEVVLRRLPAAEVETPRQVQRHHYVICLRRMVDKKDQLFHKPVGLGLSLERDSHAHFRISSIHPGGSADKSGLLCVGDILFSINGLPLAHRSTENVMQLVKGAPGTRASLVLVSNDADAFKHLQVRKSFCVDPFIAVPQLQGQSGLSGVGELVAVIVGALGLALHTVKPAVFCQLRVIDASGGDLLREELVGANKSGLALGIRVIKSRFLLEREQAAGLTDVAEGAMGTVSNFDSTNPQADTCSVLWDNGLVREHSIGMNDEYDLEIAPQMTTIAQHEQDIRWDNAMTLRVCHAHSSALEVSLWDRENYLGETLMPLNRVAERPGQFLELAVEVLSEDTVVATLQLACAWFPGQRHSLDDVSADV